MPVRRFAHRPSKKPSCSALVRAGGGFPAEKSAWRKAIPRLVQSSSSPSCLDQLQKGRPPPRSSSYQCLRTGAPDLAMKLASAARSSGFIRSGRRQAGRTLRLAPAPRSTARRIFSSMTVSRPATQIARRLLTHCSGLRHWCSRQECGWCRTEDGGAGIGDLPHGRAGLAAFDCGGPATLPNAEKAANRGQTA